MGNVGVREHRQHCIVANFHVQLLASENGMASLIFRPRYLS